MVCIMCISSKDLFFQVFEVFKVAHVYAEYGQLNMGNICKKDEHGVGQ